MIGSRTLSRTIVGSLVISAVLWTLAILFKLHVLSLFQDGFMKIFPGPYATIGAMFVCPLIALVGGARLYRRRDARRVGLLGISAGTVFVLIFVLVIGRAYVSSAMAATPRNPSTPKPIEPQTGLPVFPGAEGFGTRTPAGRGGKIIEVTTLADDGPGSLREALNDPSPRIIVFRVSGNIELRDMLYISQPFVTVAGQTAPGGGVCLKNAGLVILTNDVLVQHLRIRPGDQGKITPEDNDAIAILGKHGKVSGAHHVVIDHVSSSWSEDELVSTWFGPHDITISNCIISEALNRSRHEKKTHSAGLLIGDGSCHVSAHHNVLAHNDFRNPLISGGGTHDFVNNVIYNWGTLPAEIYDLYGNTFLNFVGNTFRPGPDSVKERFEIMVNPTKEKDSHRPLMFVQGNVSPHRPTADGDDWSLVGFGFGDADRNRAPQSMHSPKPFEVASVTGSESASGFERVLADAGATLPARDAVDERIVTDVRKGTGRIIDSPKQVGGHPVLAAGTPPVDSDHDAMPDAWEREHGLNSNDTTDARADRDGDGYTNVEEFLQFLSRRK